MGFLIYKHCIVTNSLAELRIVCLKWSGMHVFLFSYILHVVRSQLMLSAIYSVLELVSQDSNPSSLKSVISF